MISQDEVKGWIDTILLGNNDQAYRDAVSNLINGFKIDKHNVSQAAVNHPTLLQTHWIWTNLLQVAQKNHTSSAENPEVE